MRQAAKRLPQPGRKAITADEIGRGFLRHVKYTQGKDWDAASLHDQYTSLSLSVRDCLFDRKILTQGAYTQADAKRVYYLSLEFLPARFLKHNLRNLNVYDAVGEQLAKLGVNIDSLCEMEPDPGLGNGGLGRLAACFIDSLATLNYPAFGYGIRYEYGIFEQEILNGWQVERPDDWLRIGSPWEIARPEFSSSVRLYGRVEHRTLPDGRYRPTWVGYRTVLGMPYDIPIVGYGGTSVNLLRLWSARAAIAFDLDAFNRGGFVEAVHEKALSETISKVLYPDDRYEAGRELRLIQQYFFVACTLEDILRRFDRRNGSIDELPDKVAIQLNDTHPSLGVAELMRILIDERDLQWERAWELTRRCFGYTNHTLLPEALEVWPVTLLERVLPRHLQIIYEINRRFLDDVDRRWPADLARRERMSLVQESPFRGVRMANLAIVGSRVVNGVAALHTQLLRTRLVPDFAELWPEKFVNVTNGISPRTWLLVGNPRLAALITEHIGDGWATDLEKLRALEPLADNVEFRARFREIKRANKLELAEWVQSHMGVRITPDALFDMQVKRLHEYKRQLLNLLYVVMRYQWLLDHPSADVPPRVVLFAAKAAPGYGRAKLIIKLINEVARTVNRDARIGDRLKVLFVPNYRVSLAKRLIPAADLSQQISTAGMEASGTGNMKFALNGALTIGTLDGANIEIREAVGPENFFLFGLTADEVARLRPSHDPQAIVARDDALARALQSIAGDAFAAGDPELFRPIVDSLLHHGDYYMHLADLRHYQDAQNRVDQLWKNPEQWTRKAILNVARIGRFSSDRSIREYAERIWQVQPLAVTPPPRERKTTPRRRKTDFTPEAPEATGARPAAESPPAPEAGKAAPPSGAATPPAGSGGTPAQGQTQPPRRPVPQR